MNVGVRIFGAQFGLYTFKSYIPIIAAVIVAAVVGEIAHNARMKRRRLEEYHRLSRLRRLVRRQRKRRDLALLKAGEKARKVAARIAAQGQPQYTYLGRTNGHDVWHLTGTSSRGPASQPPPAIGTSIAYGGGIPSAHYFEADEELNRIDERKENQAAASPAAHRTPHAVLRGPASQDTIRKTAAATTEEAAPAAASAAATAATGGTATTTTATRTNEEGGMDEKGIKNDSRTEHEAERDNRGNQ
ncbi:hypothetical protein, conserved [Eimeria praecox]|uniref:Uncharacterized protein n=1 Tax=Eimeria praecox TaxID=51316 RepID=U6H2V2_9EIME|nr:hypothetical protein, conserved [Eimeria praecox]